MIKPLIYSLFFLSGACGLVYQVMWTRMLTHVFGSTVMAVSTVLAAFMGGLALGSYWLGKQGDKSDHPLRRYAVYEVGIGLAAVGVLLILGQLTPLYLWMTEVFGRSSVVFGVGRFVVVFALILVPTTLMGATLPILSRLMIAQLDRAGKTLSSLYAINTFGAVVGVLLAGFYLTGNLGTHLSIWLAAGVNIAVGGAAWWLARHWPIDVPASGATTQEPKRDKKKNKPKPQAAPPLSARMRRMILIGFALSGVTSLSFEVFWTRALVFYLGNSTYAFSTMLTAFLIGIAIGGYLIRFRADKAKDPVRLFAWIQIGIGLSAAAAMPLFLKAVYSTALQQWFGTIHTDWTAVIMMRFVVSLAVMLVPTILIGTTFPLVAKLLLRGLDHAGEDVGRAYAVNTVGNIAGAMLPALVLIPLLGIHRGILLMAAINVTVGLLIVAYAKTGGPPWRHLAPIGVVAVGAAVFLMPAVGQYPSNTQEPGDEVLFYKEGMAATTKVYAKPDSGEKHISVDGINIGGTEPNVDYKQQWLAHLPKLLMDDYKTELSVGLGSGILIGESARHQQLEKITCVEIAPSVVQGARFFGEENYGIMDSPRAEIVVDDGVNFLLTSTDKYDIISTDAKTQPEYGVNGVFFSREYYTLMRDHLKPGGIAIQWIPIHYPPNVFKTIVQTCTQVFPHVQLWYAERDCFLIASNHQVLLDAGQIDKRLRNPELPYDGLRKFGINGAAELLSHFVAAQDVLKANTAEHPVNSIVVPIVEFYDFQDYAELEEDRMRGNLAFILSLRRAGLGGGWIDALPQAAQKAHQAEGLYLRGYEVILNNGKRSRMQAFFDKALQTTPDNMDLRYHIFGHYFESTRDLMEQGKLDKAEPVARRAVELWPYSAEAYHRYGFILKENGHVEQAVAAFERVVELDPERIKLRHQIATHHLKQGNVEPAMKQYRAVLTLAPEDLKALNNLGYLLAEQNQFEEALALLKRAYALAPDDANIIDSYAWATFRSGDLAGARQIVGKAGEYYKQSNELAKRRRLILDAP